MMTSKHPNARHRGCATLSIETLEDRLCPSTPVPTAALITVPGARVGDIVRIQEREGFRPCGTGKGIVIVVSG